MESHVHCQECFISIPTTVTAKDGTVTDAKVHAGAQSFVVPQPNGAIGVGARQVPICDRCDKQIKARETAAKIIVPGRPSLAVV